MATITPPAAAHNLGEYQRRVRSPLARLRGAIYFYVALEAALLLVLLAAACFWLSLTLDYGVFKAARFDWVQQAWSGWMRVVLLVLAVGGVLAIVALTVTGRLLREFSDPALALVLERRFPHLLGDRLITAVELADLKKAQEQGYSPAMVLETIHEAAERVQQVPVAQVFDWRRLILRGVLAAGLTLGLYLLAGGLFLILDSVWHARGGRVGYSRFNEVVQMWSERNLLMRHTVWMRRAQLEVVNVPETGLYVGRGNAAPQVHVRALEYVVAEPDSWDGWRALKWNEAGQYIGGDVLKEQHLPFTLKPRDSSGELTVDEVARALNKFDVRAAAPGSGARDWSVYDPHASGWRPLMWADLKPATLNGDVPPSLPDWDGKPAAEALTLDDVEGAFLKARRANDAAAFGNLDKVLEYLDGVAAVHDVLDRINDRVLQPEMSRTLRRLDVPVSVHLSSSGGKDPPQADVNQGEGYDYAYDFKDLKETISFTMSADDYTTPSRSIEVVDPPQLKSLNVQESQPAYLFYPPRPVGPGEEATTLAFLHGRKQPFLVHNILESSSGESHLETPAGTDLVLTAAASKNLTEAFLVLPAKKPDDFTELRVRIDPSKVRVEWLTPWFFGVKAPLLYRRADDDPRAAVVRAKKAGDPVRLPLELAQDRRTFQVELPDVRRSLSLGFEYTADNGVRGTSLVNVAVLADAAPVVQDLSIKDIRSVTQITADGEKKTVYLVTSQARIPLATRVGDDHCLGGVFYRFSVKPVQPAPAGPAEAPKPPNAEADRLSPAPETEMTPEEFSATSIGLLGAPFNQGPLLLAVPIARARVKVVLSYSPPGFQELAVGDGLPLSKAQELLQRPQQTSFRQALGLADMKRDADVHKDTINVSMYHPKLPDKPTWRDARDPNNPLHWDFPLWPYRLMVDDDHPNITGYQMEFRVEATDADADEPTTAGESPRPHRTKSKETYTFLVVRDSYLMGLIGQDEAQQYKALNTQFQTLAGLTTDFDAFKTEAQEFETRLKASNRSEDVQLAPEVEQLLQEVDSATVVADVNGTTSHHKVDDPDKFLLNSTHADALKKRVQTVVDEIDRLDRALNDVQEIKYYLTTAAHRDPAELEKLLKDKQSVKLLLKMLDDNLPPPDTDDNRKLRDALMERRDDLRLLQEDLPVQNEDDVRRLMREDEKLQDSVDTLVALVQGFRDQKSALTQTLETVNNIQEVLKELRKDPKNEKLQTGDVLTAQDVRAENIGRSLDVGLQTTRKAAAAYEALVREQELNVLGLVEDPKLHVPSQDDVEYTRKRIIDKLGQIEKQDFPSATEAVAKFRKVLTDTALTEDDRIARSREAGKNLQAPMTRLAADLYDVLEAISKKKTRQSLKKQLHDIDVGVQDETDYAKQVQQYMEEQIFKP